MKPTWPKAAQALAGGSSNAEAARLAGVTTRTLQRWRNDQVMFSDAVENARAEMLREAAGLLAAATTDAAAKLAEIIDTGEERHALTASRIVLDMASRYQVDQTQERRISDLETAAGLRK